MICSNRRGDTHTHELCNRKLTHFDRCNTQLIYMCIFSSFDINREIEKDVRKKREEEPDRQTESYNEFMHMIN